MDSRSYREVWPQDRILIPANNNKRIRTMPYYDIECPYCEEGININHDDGYGYEEGVKHNQECDHCGKTFVYETSISFYYEVEKADCLNDGEHTWEVQRGYPRFLLGMKCSECGEVRQPTEEERKIYNIPKTWEEEKGEEGQKRGQ